MTELDLNLSYTIYGAATSSYRDNADFAETLAVKLRRDLGDDALCHWVAFHTRVTTALRKNLLAQMAQEAQQAGAYVELAEGVGSDPT